MSVKIYEAYRMPRVVARGNFWHWVRDTVTEGERRVRKVLEEQYALIAENPPEPDFGEWMKHRPDVYGSIDRARLSFAQSHVRRQYRDQLGTSERNPFDFDVYVTVRELRGDLYMLPRADMFMRGVLDFLKRDRRLEDFRYWDNTDPPRVPGGMAAWKARGKVWEELDGPDAVTWRAYATVIVCDFQKLGYIDPWSDMARRLAAKEEAARVRNG